MSTKAFAFIKQQRTKTSSKTGAFNYIKNVGKSLGYVSIGTMSTLNPVISATLKSTKEFNSTVYSSIKDFKDNSKEYNPDSPISQVSSVVKEYKTNLLSDLKSGKWYNKERIAKNDDDLMKDMGFDLDDFGDFDDDWDFDDDGSENTNSKNSNQISTEQQLNATQQSTSTIVKALDQVGYKASSATSEATVKSADYIVSNITTYGNAIYNLNAKGFGTIATGMSAINTNMQAIVSLAKPLTDHMQNSTLFYTKSTEYQEKSLQLLQTIADNTTTKNPHGTKRTGNEFTMSDVFDSDGAINLSALLEHGTNQIKKEGKDALGMLDMVGGIKGFGKMVTGSPVTGIISMMAMNMMPDKLKKSMESFNNTLAGFMKAMVGKLRRYSFGGMGILDMIKDSFLPKSNYTNNYDNGKYEKGRVDFDGITRKSIIEVIPTQLGQILSAITGNDERRFDFSNGKWKTVSEIRKDRNDQQNNGAVNGGGDYYRSLIQSVDRLNDTINDNDKNELKGQLNKYQNTAFHSDNDEFLNIMKEDFDYKKYGLSEGAWRYLQAFNQMMSNSKSGKGKWAQYYGDMQEGRDRYGESVRYDNNRGSLYSQLDNGSIVEGHKLITPGMPTDMYGNDSLHYLRLIAINSGAVSANIPLLITGNRSGKKTTRAYKITSYDNNKRSGDIKTESIIPDNTTTSASNPKSLDSLKGKENFSKIQDAMATTLDDQSEMLSGPMREYAIERANAGRSKNINEFLDAHKDEEKKYQAAIKLRDKAGNVKANFGSKFTNFRNTHEKADSIMNKIENLINIPSNTISDILDDVQNGMISATYGVKGESSGLMKTVNQGVASIFNAFTTILPPALRNGINSFAKSFKESKIGKEIIGDTKDSFGGMLRWMLGGSRSSQGDTDKQYNSDKPGTKFGTAYNPESYDDFGPKEDDEEDRQFAHGTTHTKRGYAAVSEGEIIVPKSLNPFYGSFANGADSVGKTSKFSKENIKSTLNNGAKNVGGKVIDGVTSAILKFIGAESGSAEEKDKKDIGNKVKKVYNSIFDDGENTKKGAIGGAVIGAGTSILTSAVVGPLAGAALGAAVGITVKSKKVQAALFGDYDEKTDEYKANGLLSKSLTKFMTKNVPSMAKGAAFGTAGGLLLGSPVLGAIAGSAVGFVNSSDKAQDFLFGQKNSNGEYDGGIIPANIINTIRKRKLGIGVGSVLGLLAGPFGGPVPNLIFGSALGFAAQSEKFQKWFFGDKNSKDPKKQLGITGFLKKNIADPIVGIVDKTSRLMFEGLKKKGRNILSFIWEKGAKRIGNMFLKTKAGQVASKVGGGIFNLAKNTIGLPFKAAGGVLKKTNTDLNKKSLNAGMNFMIPDPKTGKYRKMTAKERNAMRTDYANKRIFTNDNERKANMRQSTLDDLIANSDEGQRSQLVKFADAQLNTIDNYNKKIGKSERGLESGFGKSVNTKNKQKSFNIYVKGLRTAVNSDEVNRKCTVILNIMGIDPESKEGQKIRESSLEYYDNWKMKEGFKNGNSESQKAIDKLIEESGLSDAEKKKAKSALNLGGLSREDLDNFKKNIKYENKIDASKPIVSEEEKQSTEMRNTVINRIPNIMEELLKGMNYIANSQYAKPKDPFRPNISLKKKSKDESGFRENPNITSYEDNQESSEDDNSMEDMFEAQANPNAAHGRKVTKTGVVAVSEGEMIIPSELNPYYHRVTNKKQQMINEARAARNFYGSYSLGGIVSTAGKIFSGVGKVGSTIGKGVSGISKFFKGNNSGSDSGVGSTDEASDKELDDTLSKVGDNDNPIDNNLSDNGGNLGTNAGRAAAKRNSTILTAMSSVGTIPVILKGIYNKVSGIGGSLFGGGGDGKSSGMFGLLGAIGAGLLSAVKGIFNVGKGIYKIFGKAKGAIGKVKGALTGEKGLFTAGSTANGILTDVVGPAAVLGASTGLFDNAASHLGYGKKNNAQVMGTTTDEKGNTIQTIAATDKKGNLVTDKNGNILDTQGRIIDKSTIQNNVTDKLNFSQRYNQSIVRGFGNNLFTGKATGSLATKTLAKSGTGKITKNMYNSVVNANGDSKLIKTAGEVANKEMANTFISKCFMKIEEALARTPLGKKLGDGLMDMMGELEKAGQDILEKAGSKVFQSILNVAGKVLLVAEIIIDFTTGYQDASTTLKVKKPSTGWKLLAGVLRVIKNQIPIIGPMIPDDVIVDICANYIAPAMHLDIKTFKQQREEAQEELNEYNTENGTNLTWSQYNKQVLGHYTWTEKIKNGVKTGFTKAGTAIKDFVKHPIKTTASAIKSAAKYSAKYAVLGPVGMLFYNSKVKSEKKLMEDIQKDPTAKAACDEIDKLAENKDTDAIKNFDTSSYSGDSLKLIQKYQKVVLKKLGVSDFKANVKGTVSKMVNFAKQGGVVGAAIREVKSLGSKAVTSNSEVKEACNTISKYMKDGDYESIEEFDLSKYKGSTLRQIKQFQKYALTRVSASSVISKFKKKMGYDSTEKTTSINSEIQKVKSDIDRLANNGDVSGLMKYSVDNDSSINIDHKTMLKAIVAQYKQAKMPTAAGNVIKNKFKETGEKVSDFFSNLFGLNKSKTTTTDTTSSTSTTTTEKATAKAAGGSFVSQLDPRYANQRLGNSTVGQSGCGPAAAVMALNGANMNDAINIANRYQTAGGTDASYFKEEFARNGRNASYLTNKSSIVRAVASGSPVVLMGQDAGNTTKANSPFGPGSHYVVANGFDRSGNVIIRDPEANGVKKYSSKILNNVSLGVGATGALRSMRRFGIAGAGNEYMTTAHTIYSYLVAKCGIKSAAACGILGNMMQESGMNPAAQQKGGDYALGLFQWAGARKTALSNYAASKGKSWSDLQTQLEYFMQEINSSSTYKQMIQSMNSSDNPEDCAEVFEKKFERAGKPNMENRKKYARTFYSQFNGSPVGSGDISSSSSSSSTLDKASTAVAATTAASDGINSTTSSDSSTGDTSSSSTSGSTDILSTISGLFSDAFGKIFSNGNDSSSTTSTTGTSSTEDTSSSSASTRSTDKAVSGVSSSNSSTQNFLNVARSQIGTIEGTNNDTKYGKFTGQNNQAWCASFVSWCMNQAFGGDSAKAAKAMGIGPTASVSTLYDNFKKNGRMSKTPQPGDIIIYKNGTSHTGIVESVNGSNYTSIEGNTSGGKEFGRNGGMVARKTFPINNSRVTGFGRPDWSASGSGLLQPSISSVNYGSANSSRSVYTNSASGSYSNRSNASARGTTGIDMNTALILKTMLTCVETIAKNTTDINSIYTVLVSMAQQSGNTQALQAVQSAASNSSSNDTIEKNFASLRNTVDQILA